MKNGWRLASYAQTKGEAMLNDEIAKTERLIQATVNIMEKLLEENQMLKDQLIEKINEIITLQKEVNKLQHRIGDLSAHNRSIEQEFWNKG